MTSQALSVPYPSDKAGEIGSALGSLASAAGEFGEQPARLGAAAAGALAGWVGQAATGFEQQAHLGGAALTKVAGAHSRAHQHLTTYHAGVTKAQGKSRQAHGDISDALSSYASQAGDAVDALLGHIGHALASIEHDIEHILSDVIHLVEHGLDALRGHKETGERIQSSLQNWSMPGLSPELVPQPVGAPLGPVLTDPSAVKGVLSGIEGLFASSLTSGIEDLFQWGAGLLEDGIKALHAAEDALSVAIAAAHKLAHEALTELEQVGKTVAHLVEEAVIDDLKFQWHFLEGLWDGTVGGLLPVIEDLVKMDIKLNPIRLLVDPKGYFASVEHYGTEAYKLGDYIVHHPLTFGKDIGKALTDWDEWSKDPARALGDVTGEVAVIVLTAGSGAAPEGAADTAVATADAVDTISEADRAADAAGAADTAANAADDGSHVASTLEQGKQALTTAGQQTKDLGSRIGQGIDKDYTDTINALQQRTGNFANRLLSSMANKPALQKPLYAGSKYVGDKTEIFHQLAHAKDVAGDTGLRSGIDDFIDNRYVGPIKEAGAPLKKLATSLGHDGQPLSGEDLKKVLEGYGALGAIGDKESQAHDVIDQLHEQMEGH